MGLYALSKELTVAWEIADQLTPLTLHNSLCVHLRQLQLLIPHGGSRTRAAADQQSVTFPLHLLLEHC